MLKVGLIADDLTGAFDAAAPFARRGLATRVVCRADALATALEHPCDVLAVNTASRHIDGAAAAERVARACRALASWNPALLFKKIDSTLRGNVVAEITAAMTASGRGEAVVTPAMPAQGRTVRGGAVFVNGVPLAETSFAHDQLSAPARQPLARQFTDAGLRAAVVGGDGPVGDAQVWIADCADEAELGRIAGWALARAENAVMAGAAGLAEALAGEAFGPPRPLALDIPLGGIVTVVGSRAPVSREQARLLAERDADCVVLDAEAGAIDVGGAARALRSGVARLLIRVPEFPEAAPDQVAAALGRGVAALLEAAPVGAVVVTGGDTAAALLDAIGQPVVDLVGQLQPGIPLSLVTHGEARFALITKAGGFGGETLFLDIPGLLRRR